MARYTKKDADGRYYIESANGKLENDTYGRTYGEAIDRFAELENADVVPRSEFYEWDVVPKSEVDELICKLECFLCHATGGRLSKHTYELRTMETVVTDYINETYNDGYGEGYKECAREIFEEIETLFNLSKCYGDSGIYFEHDLEADIAELKKKYTEDRCNG